MSKHHIVGVAAALTLAACGGGGSGGDSGSGAPTAQGLYIGTTSTNRTAVALILSNGATYVLYSVAGNPSLIAGVVVGTIATNASQFTGQDARDFNFEGLGVSNASVTGTYIAKTSIKGAVFYPKTSVVFSATYDADYEVTPSLATIAGSYTGQAASSAGVQSATFTISSTGAVSGSSGGCAATGQFTPRTDGNAYDITVTYGAAPCVLAGQTLTGIGYYNATTRTMYAASPTADRTNGALLIGTKP